MSLRFKLPLFTALFVFLAAAAILYVSVQQTYRRGERNITDIRTFETARVKNVIREHVNFIYSLIHAQDQRSLTKQETMAILNRIKTVTYDNGRGYFWVVDTSSSPKFLIHPFIDSLSGAASLKVISLLRTVNAEVQTKGDGYVRLTWPKRHMNELSDSSFSMLCYSRFYRSFGWVVASGRYTDDIDAIINQRVAQTKDEINDIIRDRLIFAAIVLAICMLVIIVFTGMITRPINKFVSLTEEITSERKGYSERIAISSRDEIGRLAQSFNLMLGHIQKTLAKLEENGKKYRELVENANSAIIRIEKTGLVLFVNEYAQKLFGFSPEEIQGKNINDILSPVAAATGEKSRSSLKDVFDAPGVALYMEEPVATKNGGLKWVAWTNRPIYDDAGVLKEILCVGSDITARKKAEDLAKVQQIRLIQTDKMATLGVLVSGIAHEINNPNNFIILNGENLSDMWKDIMPVLDDHCLQNPAFRLGGLPYEEMRKELPGLLHGINEGARRIKRIVQNLKDFARQDPGDIDQQIQIRQVVDAATVIIGNLIKKATNKFEVIQETEMPDVKGNFQRLEQVIINLTTNACEATKNAGDPITVVISRDAENRSVTVSVLDHGEGIPPENLKYIMDPFFTTKRDKGGTGLGLAISYSIVKDHGGDLRIESAPGKGTKAIVVLPVYST